MKMKNLQIDEHNNKDIIKANKFIAEFMWGTPNHEEGVNVWTIPDDNRGIFWSLSLHYEETGEAREDELYFHSSWDWLMPVVEKIDNIDKFSKWCELENFCINRIDKVFSSAVKFIEWYNENNK